MGRFPLWLFAMAASSDVCPVVDAVEDRPPEPPLPRSTPEGRARVAALDAAWKRERAAQKVVQARADAEAKRKRKASKRARKVSRG